MATIHLMSSTDDRVEEAPECEGIDGLLREGYRRPDFGGRDVASALGIGRARLGVRCRRAGRPPIVAQLTRLRLNAAAELLVRASRESLPPMEEIARSSGFADGTAMDRAFRKMMRTSAYEFWLRQSTPSNAA